MCFYKKANFCCLLLLKLMWILSVKCNSNMLPVFNRRYCYMASLSCIFIRSPLLREACGKFVIKYWLTWEMGKRCTHHWQPRVTGCAWQGQLCQLVLHYEDGFSLLEAAGPARDPKVLWNFPFEKLRSSADDGARLLWLDFGADDEIVSSQYYVKMDEQTMSSYLRIAKKCYFVSV